MTDPALLPLADAVRADRPNPPMRGGGPADALPDRVRPTVRRLALAGGDA